MNHSDKPCAFTSGYHFGIVIATVIPHVGRNEMFRTNTSDDRSLYLPRTKYKLPGGFTLLRRVGRVFSPFPHSRARLAPNDGKTGSKTKQLVWITSRSRSFPHRSIELSRHFLPCRRLKYLRQLASDGIRIPFPEVHFGSAGKHDRNRVARSAQCRTAWG